MHHPANNTCISPVSIKTGLRVVSDMLTVPFHMFDVERQGDIQFTQPDQCKTHFGGWGISR